MNLRQLFKKPGVVASAVVESTTHNLPSQNSTASAITPDTTKTSQLSQNIWELCTDFFLKVEGQSRSFTVYEWMQQTWSFEKEEQGNTQQLKIKTTQRNQQDMELLKKDGSSVLLYELTLKKEQDCVDCQVHIWPVADQVLDKTGEPNEAKLILLYQLLTQLKQHASTAHLRTQLFAWQTA